MPKRPAIARLLRAIARSDEGKAIAVLDEMTPWHGLAEVAADLAGPALCRALIQQAESGREELADALEELAAELRA